MFLPAYRPDSRPIEDAFFQLKNYLRKAKARTREALETAITAGPQTIHANDARGGFDHGGFLVAQSTGERL